VSVDRKVFTGGEFLCLDVSGKDVFVPEEFSEDHRMIFKTAMDFVRKEVLPNLEAIETLDAGLIRGLLKKAGELGLSAVDVPESYGGLGLDKITSCLVAEAIGNGLSFAVTHGNQTGIATLPIVLFGSEDQKKKYLPGLAGGDLIGAYCLTEANAGSDALNSRTKAVLSPDGRHYLLNGEKMFVTNGAWADTFIVYGKVDGEKFTGFIVERGFPGISFGAEEKKMGIKGSSTRAVIFQDCPVPVENVLLGVGKGHKVAFNILNLGRFKVGAFTLGGCKTSVKEAVKYANNRIQFGVPISSFGLIRQKISEMTIRSFFSESLEYRVAGAIDDRLNSVAGDNAVSGDEMARSLEEFAPECSICKVYSTECLDYCVDEWVQILGGYGYCSEYGAERAYRDSRINRIFEGTNEINRLLIPGTLLKRSMQGRLDLLGAVENSKRFVGRGKDAILGKSLETLDRENRLIKFMKSCCLLSMDLAVTKFGTGLAGEQEVLAIIADMIIETFAAESGCLRALKSESTSGGRKSALMTAAVEVYVAILIPKFIFWCQQLSAYIKGQEQHTEFTDAVKILKEVKPIDLVTRRRFIADNVAEMEKYPFDY
jgi:alkylation response protein AidB-like acyl-CoA dehydrogenase